MHAFDGSVTVRRPGGHAGACSAGPPAIVPGMTILWFIIWLIANNVGANEPLLLDPVNAWTATLIVAVGLDLGSAHAMRR